METVHYHFGTMRQQRLEKCPVCGGDLEIVEYHCTRCGTQIRGRFRPTEFDRLSEEDLEFLRLFLRSRGTLSVAAQELGISRPTARARLDHLLQHLGYTPLASAEEEAREPGPDPGTVLDLLEQGKISPQEAMRLLRGEPPEEG